MQVFKKERIGNRRIYYVFGKKILSYSLKGGGITII